MKTFIHKMQSRKWNSFVVAACRLQSLHVFFFTLAVLGTVCVGNAPLRADSVYDVTGTIGLMGNTVAPCAGTCSETINFSFQYGYQYEGNGLYQGYALPGTIQVSAFGDLGSLFATTGTFGNPQLGPNPGCSGGDANNMEFLDPAGDEIDLHACGAQALTPFAPSFSTTSTLYGCATATCTAEFVPPSWGIVGPRTGLFVDGTAQTSVTAIPEGGAFLGYLAISLAPIGLAIRLSKRKPRQCRLG